MAPSDKIQENSRIIMKLSEINKCGVKFRMNPKKYIHDVKMTSQ